jgi:hypothetical protein
MDLATFRELLWPAGQAALAEATALSPTEQTRLADLTRLRKRYPAGLASAALETALLRRHARAKFSRAGAMYFTREALEQSTSETVAAYRAERFAGISTAADLCCGTGSDAIARARHAGVVAVDSDPLRLAMAEANAETFGVSGRITFTKADLTVETPPEADAGFCDPSRRADGLGSVSMRDYRPPAEVILGWRDRLPALGVKVAPAVPAAELAGLGAEAEFISLDGELK